MLYRSECHNEARIHKLRGMVPAQLPAPLHYRDFTETVRNAIVQGIKSLKFNFARLSTTNVYDLFVLLYVAILCVALFLRLPHSRFVQEFPVSYFSLSSSFWLRLLCDPNDSNVFLVQIVVKCCSAHIFK